jgi:hypothetical protein
MAADGPIDSQTVHQPEHPADGNIGEMKLG